MKFEPEMQNHRPYKMLGADFWFLAFFRKTAIFGKKFPFLVKIWPNFAVFRKKNPKIKNLLPTFCRAYDSAFLVQISGL